MAKKKRQETRSLGEAWAQWQDRGVPDDQINPLTELLGVDPNDVDARILEYEKGIANGSIKKDPKTGLFPVRPEERIRVRYSVEEAVNNWLDDGLSHPAIRNRLFRRGIYNYGGLTETEKLQPLPAQKLMTPADKILLKTYEADFQAGKYDDWKANRKETASNRLARNTVVQTGVDYDKVSAYVDIKLDRNIGYSDVELTSTSLPKLNKAEKDLADKITSARTSLNPWRGQATGFFVGGATRLAQLFGIERSSSAEEGNIIDAVQDFLAGKLERALTTKRDTPWDTLGYRLQGKKAPEQSFPKSGRLLKETKEGKDLLKRTMQRRKEALQELQDLIDPSGDEEPFPLKMSELEKVFGTPDEQGRIRNKGWFNSRGNKDQKRLEQIIQNTMKVEKRLETEKEFADFGEWLDAAVPEPLRINATDLARKSRAGLNRQFRDTVKSKPGTFDRIGNELFEIAQGLVSLTSYIAAPGGNMAIKQMADLVASGKMTQEAAQQYIDEQGFQEGAALPTGILAYMEPFLGDTGEGYDALKDQIRAEPVSFIISMLGAGALLKTAKAAHSAHVVNRGKKLAKEFGFSDAQIAKIVEEAEEVHRKTQTPILRKWFNTVHGKHAANKFLGAMDHAKVPELVQAGIGYTLLGGVLSPDVGGAAAIGGLGVGLRGTREALVASARAMNTLEEVGAQTSPSGQVVSDNMVAETESGQNTRAAFATESEYLLERQQNQNLDPNEVLGEQATNVAAATELSAKARAYVGTSPDVVEAKRLYDSAPVGSPEKRLLRQEYLNTRDLALIRFIEGDGTPENPGVTLVKPSTAYQDTVDALVEHRAEARATNEETIRNLETEKQQSYDTKVSEKVEKRADAEITRLNKKKKRLEEKQATADEDLENLIALEEAQHKRRVEDIDEQLAQRREQPGKGSRKVTRREAVNVARKNLEEFDEANKGKLEELEEQAYRFVYPDMDKSQLGRLVDGHVLVEEYGRKVLREPRYLSSEYRYLHVNTKSERRRIAAAHNRVERFKKKRKDLEEKLRRAEADFEDPGVKIDRRVESYASARVKLDNRLENRLNAQREKTAAEKLQRESQIKALESDIEQVEDLRRQGVDEGVLPGDDDRPKWMGNLVSEEQLQRRNRQFDNQIERARELEELGERRTQLALDLVARNKAAEYRRALEAFDGVHVEDGDYVQRLNVDVKFEPETGAFHQRGEENIFIKNADNDEFTGPFDASEMRKKYANNEVDDDTIIRIGDNDPQPLSESFEINRPDQVRLANGWMGDSENLSASTGNMIFRLLAFPGDDAQSIVRALALFTDKTMANIQGVIANGWKKGRSKAATSGSRFLPRSKQKRDADPTSYLVRWVKEQDKKDRKALNDNRVNRDAALDEFWADETISAIMSGQLSDRGANDLKRIILDEYGEILISQGTARMLVEPNMRKRFVSYVKAKLRDSGLDLDIENLPDKEAKEVISRFENGLEMMIKDFAQGRTLDNWASFGRVNYRFTDKTGKPGKYVDGSGNTVDATLENIFKDFVAGELSEDEIFRARQNAVIDAAFYTASAYEGRAVLKEVILDSTGGMDDKIWNLGPSHPDHQRVVFKFFLENGDLPPAVRIRESQDGTIVSDPFQNRSASAVFDEVFSDPETTNINGLSLDEAKRRISMAYSNGLSDVDSRTQYVRLGSELDPSNIPGLQRIGERPVNRSGPGLASQHSILQPEHIKTSVESVTPGSQSSDIYIRREMGDAIGWMLDTHAALQFTGILRFAQGINAMFKWGKTAGSLLNPLTNFISNNKTHVINQGRTPFVAVGDFVSTAHLWSQYRAGKLNNTPVGNRIELLIRQGFTEASDLLVEVDRTMRAMFANPGDVGYVEAIAAIEDLYRGGKIPEWIPEALGGGKRVVGIRELTELQNRVYKRFGDELYKLTDAMMEMEKKEKLLEEMPEGHGIHFRDLDSGAGFKDDPPIGTIVKTEDGYAAVYNRGAKRGKVFRSKTLHEGEVGELLAKGAMGHASSLYYNLGKVGRGMKMLRQLEAFVVSPFQSWRSKALDIPMVKRGMFYRMFVDDVYTISTDPMTNLKIYREALNRHIRRNFWLAAVKDKQADNTALRDFLPSYAKGAILTGTGANRELLIAESSNPIGGIAFISQMLAEVENTVAKPSRMATNSRSFLANEQFWREFNKKIHKKEGSAVFLEEAVSDFISGGALSNLILPLFGRNPRTGEPFVEGQEREYVTEVLRAFTPNWLDRIGVTHAVTGGYAETGVPYELAKAYAAEFEWDSSKFGTKSLHTMKKAADDSITLFNVLLARRMRKVDGAYILLALREIPGATVNRINLIREEARKDGRTELSLLPEELAEIESLQAVSDAAQRQIVRASNALIENGAKTPEQIDNIIRSKKLQSWSYQKEYRKYLQRQMKIKKEAKRQVAKEKLEMRKLMQQ